jgi:hypothetical protein
MNPTRLLPLLAVRLFAQTVSAPALLHSTYFGGSGPDYVTDSGLAIARGPSGVPYVLGQTGSATFPATDITDIQANGCGTFITRLSADGRARLGSTFIGGRFCSSMFSKRGGPREREGRGGFRFGRRVGGRV